uniref:C2H2-type domain-containing protein n=1 Tax=Oryza punctata TaxID=4537 RepID=A0A0E0KBM5_ORYPU
MAGGGRCSSLLRGFVSLFFLLFIHIGHAGCCFSTGSSSQALEEDDTAHGADGRGGGGGGGGKRRKISPLAFSPSVSSSTVGDERARARRRQVSSLASSVRFYLHRIFSYSSGAKNGAAPAAEEEDEVVTTTVSSPLAHSSSSCLPQRQPSSVVLSTPSSPCASPFLSPLSPQSLSITPVVPSSPHNKQIPQVTTRQSSFRSLAARGDVFPCKVCGEVLSKPQQLELHQAMKHSLSELSSLDSSMNIIRMIFFAGWKPAVSGAGEPPSVRRILRIHHNPRVLTRFEEYRDLVRARAARRCNGAGAAAVEERCVADGNERLRFYCSTMLCTLGAGVCGSPYCCTCSILRHGFAGKQADVDGIATYSSGRAAHASLPDDVEREFAFLQVRRAMLVCRVVAGRVGRGAADDKVAYDSMVPLLPTISAAAATRGDDDVELLVFNPRAVLPCFVIIYSC